MHIHNKKGIGIILNSTWNIYNFRRGLIQELSDAGYRVVAIAPKDDSVDILLKELNCVHVPLKNLSRKGVNPFRDILLIWELYRIIKANCLDLILNYTLKPVIYGTIAGKLSGVRVVNTITGLGYSFLSENYVGKIVRSLLAFTLSLSHRVYFQNKDDLHYFLSHKLVPLSISDVLDGSGVDIDFFGLSPYPSDEKINVLFVGRLLVHKGIKELFDAAELVWKCNSAFHLYVVGAIDDDNPASISPDYLNNWRKKKFVTFYGKVNDVRPFIEKSHVFVLPSYREGLPRSVLEAMSMGRPIIATDVPGCRETVIPNENGYLVSVKNSKALAHAILRFSKLSYKEKRAMGLRSREIVLRRFSKGIINSKYLDTISSLLTK